MTKIIDLIGKKIEMLTVIELSKVVNKETAMGDKYIVRYYNCLCDCGNTCEIASRELNSKRPTKSCGCARIKANKNKSQDLSGKKFERLTAKYRDSEDIRKWVCDCDCGKETLALHAHLKNGNTTSCGCKRTESCSKQLTEKHSAFRLANGISEENYSRDENVIERGKFNTFSRKILARDSYTCAWCSQVGFELNVHHLDFWFSNPDKRFDRNNLVTLCKPCHATIHQNNYHGPADEIMTSLLRGYCSFIESEENYCTRIELTPN